MKFASYIPFVEHLGMELLRAENGEAEIALELRDELCNSWAVAHGGVTMSLMDVVMAHAARSPDYHLPDGGPSVVTVEMKTSFMRPCLGRLLARGRLLTRTATMAFCEASVLNTQAELLAHATGTFKFIRQAPNGGRKLARPEAAGS